MPTITFQTNLSTINSWLILKLPKSASIQLPSRGMVFVKGTMNAVPFEAVLDPDGKGSHWFRVDNTLLTATQVKDSNIVTLTIEPSTDWPEPIVPNDLKNALAACPLATDLWTTITPMARWDWIRWIGSTKNAVTRSRRIQVTCDKLKSGERRPCCFNRNLCTDPTVSQNGILLEVL